MFPFPLFCPVRAGPAGPCPGPGPAGHGPAGPGRRGAALRDISMATSCGNRVALIGPNGAGKTTLIAQLSGEIFPDNGRIVFQEKNITMLPPYKRSHLGIARSFQITSLMQGMDVIDNVALATQANDGHAYKFWKPARDDRDLRQSAIDLSLIHI